MYRFAFQRIQVCSALGTALELSPTAPPILAAARRHHLLIHRCFELTGAISPAWHQSTPQAHDQSAPPRPPGRCINFKRSTSRYEPPTSQHESDILLTADNSMEASKAADRPHVRLSGPIAAGNVSIAYMHVRLLICSASVSANGGWG